MVDGCRKHRNLARFGSLFYCTFLGALAGFAFGATFNLFTQDGADYWLVDGHYYSCLGAVVGLVGGIFRDVVRRVRN